MTLPASGTISMSQFNVELGQVSTYSGSLSWVASLTKVAQRPSPNSMAGYYGKAYYLKNNDGNCNNGNCNCASNCDFECVNCSASQCVNCVNCDAQSWLQNNCNCACTYNCNAVANQYYNCNCQCLCACDCSCVAEGTLVTLITGEKKRIESLLPGAILFNSAFVVGARSPLLGNRVLWEVNGNLKITGDHLIKVSDGWACIEPELFPRRIKQNIAPSVEYRRLVLGDLMLTETGWEEVVSIEDVNAHPETPLFTLYVSGEACFFANGVCVDGILTPETQGMKSEPVEIRS